MPANEEETAEMYSVVINSEEQYSIWPSRKDVPQGWRSVGKQGGKTECLKYISEVWADMRPASLRQASEKTSKK